MLLSKQHGREINGWALVHLEIQEKKDSWWQSFIISQNYYWEYQFHDKIFLKWKLQTQVKYVAASAKKRRDCLRKRHRKQPRYINPKDWETILVN
ncbi:hypothetical protein IGI04_029402 [Brassica rapa subsp. trilocularis]|uniref:Uncharacterized protein n=1 Tax=Brassica rapa subsp. trilocularis TaxID=1813537 RepID=A0ABQ7LRP3_BRACM|nr:hypothetical protein IGI04_029402 [Brassica rapa subsp. trilocularis]